MLSSRCLSPATTSLLLSTVSLFALMDAPALAQDRPAPSQLANGFPEPDDTQKVVTPILTPADAAAALRLPTGFRATLFAAEPDVRQPIALATDARGRLWVAENYTYSDEGDRWDDRLRDRILVLEDRDHDGRFDQRTVFWDQARQLTSVEVGFGGVWALCPPHLLFLPDRNGDDVLDGAPEVILDGWNVDEVGHNIANGLRWGPDGWLYGRHGITSTSYVGLPGVSQDQRVALNCSIWRYHPVRQAFEVVCHGTTNPWGMDWDEHGQLFFINTVIGHLWHVLPGAHYQRMFGDDFNPHLYELLPQTADHFHWDTGEKWSDIRRTGITPTTDRAGGGHAHSGMMIYQGGVWPERYHNTVFTVNLHGHRLNNDRLARRGSGYVATHTPDFLTTEDEWFRGVEVTASPDGGMFIADWSDIGECHENDGVHRSTGRIYKITYSPAKSGEGTATAAGALRGIPDDFRQATNELLVAAQPSRNEWVVRQARQVLHERAVAGHDMGAVHAELRQMFVTAPAERDQLRALWALYVTGGTDESWLLKQLNHSSEHVRCWAVQLLYDQPLSPAAQRAFVELAGRDHSGLVLQRLASSLQRMPLDNRLELAERIGEHSEFIPDPVLPLMLWYGIEPAVVRHGQQAVELSRRVQFPTVREYIARRLTGEIERQPQPVVQLVAALAAAPPDQQLDYLRGMSAALRGWRRAPAPSNWNTVAQQLSTSGQAQLVSLSRELSVVFGDGRALDELRQVAASTEADLEIRRSALRSLTAARADGVVELLRRLIRERDLQRDAIRGLAACKDPDTPQFLLAQFRRLNPPAQAEVINTLASRPEYARSLLDAVAADRIDREAVTPFHLRQIQSLGDDSLTATIVRLWPELKQLSAEKSKRIGELRDQLTPPRLAAADLENGRALFERSCTNCHVLLGKGGKIGPDLTGAQRNNLHYLLENIVDPSATVTENYRMSIVLVADGRVLNGILTEKNDKTVTVVTPTDRIVLALDEIEEIRPAELSIMPEGQLDVLSPDQIRDLIGYVMQAK